MRLRILFFLAITAFYTFLYVQSALAQDVLKPIRFVQTKQKVIALTFDDGPTLHYTSTIVQLLKKYHAKATFFMTGKEVLRFPSQAQAVHNAGMEIGNHGHSHALTTRLNPTQLREEVRQSEHIIEKYVHVKTSLFRAPTGELNQQAIQGLHQMGYQVIGWSVDARDYFKKSSPTRITKDVLSQVHPGAIVLFHDGVMYREATITALQTILPALQKQGYSFITVSELLKLQSSSRVS